MMEKGASFGRFNHVSLVSLYLLLPPLHAHMRTIFFRLPRRHGYAWLFALGLSNICMGTITIVNAHVLG
jgi:hypothetical protein